MGPLEGIKIIDISTIVSGPLAASMLGDQGAEVIKIEPPFRGENARVMGPIKEGSGALFAAVNRSKRSLAMDLKQEESKKIIYKLIETAAVIAWAAVSEVILSHIRVFMYLGWPSIDWASQTPAVAWISGS